MKLTVLVALLLLSSFSYGLGPAYVDLEDGQLISVFNAPGKNWKNCKTDRDCKSEAWLDNSSKVEVISAPTKMKVESPYTGEKVEEEYVKVRYYYQRKSSTDSKEKGAMVTQQGEGWVESAYLSSKKQKAFFTESPKVKEPVCDPKTKSSGLGDLKNLTSALENKGVNGIAEALTPLTGQCVINPKDKKRRFEDGNIYDNYVLPIVQKQKLPKIPKEDGTSMTKQDLVDVDSLARTLYGEMAGCFKHGLQYPMAVAKIVANRADASNRTSEFIKGDHNANKSSMAKMVTSKSQFSVWRPKHGKKVNNSLNLALCPPSDKDKPSWQGHKPSNDEVEIWQNAMKIATETVLFPKKFKKRTEQVNGYFYTSGMGQFYAMKQVFPWIEERQVKLNSCVEVWKESGKS